MIEKQVAAMPEFQVNFCVSTICTRDSKPLHFRRGALLPNIPVPEEVVGEIHGSLGVVKLIVAAIEFPSAAGGRLFIDVELTTFQWKYYFTSRQACVGSMIEAGWTVVPDS